jgi:hypothetical protein
MIHTQSEDEPPLDPAQAKIVARVRWLMLLSGAATIVGIAVVLTVVGYRVFKIDGTATRPEVTARLPKGARILQTAVSAGRVAVTLDVGGAIEVQIFDLKTLQPTGRLKFEAER